MVKRKSIGHIKPEQYYQLTETFNIPLSKYLWISQGYFVKATLFNYLYYGKFYVD